MVVEHYIGLVFRAVLFLSIAAALPVSSFAQGPIFLSPANTAPINDFAPSFSYVRKGSETDLTVGGLYGLLPPVSLALSTTMIANEDGPFQLGRVQVQAKLRLYQKVGEGTRTVLGFSSSLGLPAGESVRQVAGINTVSNVIESFTASHVTRRAGFFAGAQYTLDAHEIGNLSTATIGVAASWRLKPAAPGSTGGPGFTLFGETLGHYEADHSGWFAVAPGFMYRSGPSQFKVGLRMPVVRWNSTSKPMFTAGTSFFIPTKSSKR